MNEDADFYILPDGRYVFTRQFLLKRGYCCGSGCRHCPYDYVNVPEPKKSMLLAQRTSDEAEQTGEGKHL